MTLENIVYACYEEHKKHTSNWQHGKPQKTYYDLEGLMGWRKLDSGRCQN